jgi:hypothetical protein
LDVFIWNRAKVEKKDLKKKIQIFFKNS